MEKASPWASAAQSAGKTTLLASLFPFATLVAYAAGKGYGAAMAVLLPGGILFVVALLSTIVTMVAARRSEGFGWLGISIASLLAQGALLVLVAMAWSATQRDHPWRPRHRQVLRKAEALLSSRELSKP